MPTLAANGIDIYYERTGSGPRLLFLNGSGSSLASSALLLKPFIDRFDVVAHDQRGLGQTSVPPGPYTMADYASGFRRTSAPPPPRSCSTLASRPSGSRTIRATVRSSR